jgi:hypothetical protein
VLIKISEKVLETEVFYPVLDVIVLLIERSGNRHAIDPSNINIIARSSWVLTRPALADVLRASAKSSFHSQPSDAVSVLVDKIPDNDSEVDRVKKQIKASPFDALILLTSPLHILVENETTDGAFLLWMARLLDLPTFRQAYNDSRITFRQAGGKGELIKSAKALSHGVWESKRRGRKPLSLRVIAILDSDARYPGHRPNKWIEDGIRELVAFVHVLKRRTIENYVSSKPMKHRLAHENRDEHVRAYFRLELDQRRHFPIKDGFKSADRPPASQDQVAFIADSRRDQQERTLFSTVQAADWPRLQDGFGSGIADIFIDRQYRCSRTEEFHFDTDIRDECRKLIKDIIAHM